MTDDEWLKDLLAEAKALEEAELAAAAKAAEEKARKENMTTEQPTEPDQNDPAWWNADDHLMDRRYSDTHPRNTPGTVEYNQARQETVQAAIRRTEENRTLDQYGHPVPDGNPYHAAFIEQKRADEQAWLEARPVIGQGGFELIDPSKPETDAVNDPAQNQDYEKIIQHRQTQRRTAVINNLAPSHRSGPTRVDDELKRRGLVVTDTSPRQMLDAGELKVVEQAAASESRSLADQIAGLEAQISEAKALRRWDEVRALSQQEMRLKTQKIFNQMAPNMP